MRVASRPLLELVLGAGQGEQGPAPALAARASFGAEGVGELGAALSRRCGQRSEAACGVSPVPRCPPGAP